jgi:hypothetical protein
VIGYFCDNFGTLGGHLLHFYHFGILHQQNSGNPEQERAGPVADVTNVQKIALGDFH